MFILKRDVTNDKEEPLLRFSKFGENNESLIDMDGSVVSQTWGVYGGFEKRVVVGPNEKIKVNGQLITFWPVGADRFDAKIYTYTWVEVPN